MSLDQCSAELVSIIFQFACQGTKGGETARATRLVSKRYEEIISPLEIRTLAISGQRQLEKTVERVDRELCTTGVAAVHHLFVCDFPTNGFEPSAGDMMTKVGRTTNTFWSTVAELVLLLNPTLRTLSLLMFHHFGDVWNPLERGDGWGILNMLRKPAFPCLQSLTVRLDADIGLIPSKCNEEVEPCLQLLNAPLLRKLTIIGPYYLHSIPILYDGRLHNTSSYYILHPLLNGFPGRFPLLEELHLQGPSPRVGNCSDCRHLMECTGMRREICQRIKAGIDYVSLFVHSICGIDTEAGDRIRRGLDVIDPAPNRPQEAHSRSLALASVLSSRRLTSNLKRITLTLYEEKCLARNYEDLRISGLKVYRLDPKKRFPLENRDKSEYEAILNAWYMEAATEYSREPVFISRQSS